MTGCEVEEVYAAGGVRGFPVFAKYDDVDTAVLALRLLDGPLTAMTVSRRPARLRRARGSSAPRTASRSDSARRPPSVPSNRACRRRPAPPGPISSCASNRPTRPSWRPSSRSPAAMLRAPARPTTASHRCASPRRPIARSTNTDRCARGDPRLGAGSARSCGRPGRKEVSMAATVAANPYPALGSTEGVDDIGTAALVAARDNGERTA